MLQDKKKLHAHKINIKHSNSKGSVLSLFLVLRCCPVVTNQVKV